MKKQVSEKHEHKYKDNGKGYFISSGKFFHDPSSMTSNTHEMVCECGDKKYIDTEDLK